MASKSNLVGNGRDGMSFFTSQLTKQEIAGLSDCILTLRK